MAHSLQSVGDYAVQGSEKGAPAPLEVLRRVWGYPAFRGMQARAIQNVMAGKDSLVLFPTGKGKSLCFQLPALCMRGVGVVVSPLVALMRDQVEELKELGVSAGALWSDQDQAEAADVKRRLRSGELKLLYVTPERIASGGLDSMLGRDGISLLAVDEAHCISVWGNNFRKDYLSLGRLKEMFPNVPVIALTATADPHTQKDILKLLNLEDAAVFVDSFDRQNISYEIALRSNARTQLLDFLKRHEGESGIVYCLSRKKVEETVEWLNEHGIRAKHYHAKLDPALKTANQDAFRLEEGLCLVATVAFGMGINKPNVRYVAHLDLPSSVESYYQETGRAGRDGLPSEAFMVYGMQDIVQRGRMIDEGDSTDQIKRIERAKLNALVGICETTACRRQSILRHFGEDHPGGCGNCDTCTKPIETWDGTEASIKALAAIYRTGERFGVGHVIDVLTGKVTDKTKRFGHVDLPVFGAGRELTAAAWQSIYRQLLTLNLIRIEHDEFGAMKLQESAAAVFKKERSITLRKDRTVSRGERRPGSGTSLARSGLSAPDREVFEVLRQERLEISRELGVAPYVVFPDTTLIALATRRPTRLNEMLDISGIGQTKLERYGERFLRALQIAVE
ncbi:DNA helicase RecQ [Rhizobium ruizarguesonis]|uniref:DNA helicase RecQ n=1 Tax=Rhizobium ruizarguesonis TaxID=2081791 RepID=UPI001031E52B|nr:DNA helicase RecQ [Rhizobium ruizarguesonis]TAT86633.1 DNA helicase RecQ [Rhizobium ruizarguesonis]